MPSIHKKYGGSGAARDIGCGAHHRLIASLPKAALEGSNPAADEGSMLHDCMETIYGKGYPDIDPCHLLENGVEFNGQHLTQELIDSKLQPAIDTVEDLLDDLGIVDWTVEPFVEIAEDMGGSIDFLALSDDKTTLLVLDYKFGFNTVKAENNAQLQFYALAASISVNTSPMFENVTEVVLAIIQPNNDGEILERWDISLEQLDNFETKYLNAVERQLDPNQEPTAGAWCKYCPAMATCPVKTGQALKATRAGELLAANLAEYLPMADQVTEWAKAVQKMAHEQLELGTPIEGYKLVAKRASRVWNDDAAVDDKVRKAKKIKIADAFDLKLKSPAQMQKVCKELGVDFKQYDQYISSVSSGSTLAKQSDKRPALLPVQGLAQLNQMND